MSDFIRSLKNVFIPENDNAEESENSEPLIEVSQGQEEVATVEKKKPLKNSDVKRMYGKPSSFIDKLPWYEFLTESKTILLDDGISVGAVFDVIPIATEGRSYDWLQNRRDIIQEALQDCFDELPKGPWIVQQYTYDEDNMNEYIRQMREYPKSYCKDTVYTKNWLDMMERHLRGICKEGGLFEDKSVLDAPWGGKIRKTKMVVYRRLPPNWKSFTGMTPEEELNDTVEKLESSLREAGVGLVQNSGKMFYEWMLDWFNPSPEMTGGDREKFRHLASFADEDDLPYADDLAESLFFELPRSDAQTQTWWFNDMPHRAVRVHKIRRTPNIGQVAGEVGSKGEASSKASCMMDKMPPGTIMATTIVVTPQDEVQNHVNTINQKSKGESVCATMARKACDTAKELMGNKHKLYRGMSCVYIRGDNLKDLRRKSNKVGTLLLSNQLQPVKDENESLGLDAYLYNLPMVFDTSMDKNYKATRPIWSQHLANLSAVFGRHRGTGNPGQTMFNRGGEPISFDPFNGSDRKKNAHGLILGPTGAGKSALITTMSSQIMALLRPRLFIIEAGNSFGLLADYFASQDMTVNRVSLKPGSGVSLPPFADAGKLLQEGDGSDVDELDETLIVTEEAISDRLSSDYKKLSVVDQKKAREEVERQIINEAAENSDGDDEERDIMGEMEIIATLMITGGEEEEAKKLTRADRRMIRDAILNGAKIAVSEGRQTMTSDVADGFVMISKNDKYPEQRKMRAFEMGESLRMFCDGFEGEVFNTEGEAWPDADVTIVDLATFSREGYGAQLAIAYTSIMMSINNLAEKHQHDERPIVMLTDEAHIITTNPLLAPFVVKVVKMWRKLGAWYWVATQNMADFPNSAKKMLNMIEWWICLVMPQDEIEDIAKFKSLSQEQKELMLSATKEPKKFTEGVVLSENMEALFRNVPPSLTLSLAGTEKDEKTERAKYMRQFGITEVEAAEYVGKMIDFYRGIANKPEDPIPRKSVKTKKVKSRLPKQAREPVLS